MSRHRWFVGLLVVALLIGSSAMFVRHMAGCRVECDERERQVHSDESHHDKRLQAGRPRR
jgi:hypothetical protein